MSSQRLVFNGIDGATGDYLTSGTAEELASTAVKAFQQEGEQSPEAAKVQSNRAKDFSNRIAATYRVPGYIDEKNLAQTGWSVVFHRDADPAVRAALAPLIEHRRAQAGALFKEFAETNGFRPNDTKWTFLARNKGAVTGAVDPEKSGVPYFVLLVGSPDEIPFEFQYQLDIQYAVGRLYFDTPAEYRRYAESVVAAEQGLTLPRRAVFFGVRNPDDGATALSADHLVAPLHAELPKLAPNWTLDLVAPADARKQRLAQLLGGDDAPALLFSASHGMGFPKDHPLQLPHQGALLCQDWPGPKNHVGPIPPEYYFAGDDLSADAKVWGSIVFFFACFGGGTPRLDEFSFGSGSRTEIAPHNFMAALPQRLLSHPNGGALAVVAHVERAWGYSFIAERAGRQLTVYKGALERVLSGYPVGVALDYFNERYAELGSDLSNELVEVVEYNKTYDPVDMADKWIAHNDARGFVVIGDPAVRLSLADSAPAARPAFAAPAPTIASATPVATPAPPTAEASPPPAAAGSGFAASGSAPAEPTAALSDLVARLASALEKSLTEPIEVTTSDERGKLLARSRIAPSGAIETVVVADDALAAATTVHRDMVAQAQANRAGLVAITRDLLEALRLAKS